MTNALYSPWLSLRGSASFVAREIGDDASLAFLVAAANEITAAANRIERSVTVAMSNEEGSELGNSRKARKVIAAEVAVASKSVNAAINRAHEAINLLTAKSNPSTPEDVPSALYYSEVRSALLRMSDAERRRAMATALASGDESFVGAATSGSPTLSGMTAVEQKVVIDQWRRARHPETSERLERLRKAVDQLDRIKPMFERWANNLVGEEPSAKRGAA